MRCLVICFALLAASLPAQATFIPGDGTDLREYMDKYDAMRKPGFEFSNATDAFQVGVLVGYVEGIALALEAQKFVCPPNIGLSSANHLDIIGRYLKKTPKTEKEVGAVLIKAAFQEVFPCGR